MTEVDTRHLVDPQLAPLLEQFAALVVSAETLPALRAGPPPVAIDPAELKRTEQTIRTVPGPKGAPDVEVVIYRPTAAAAEPRGRGCIFHIHGGGYILGNARAAEPAHRSLAADLHCLIVSVNYRLAPETTFPGNIEDCYAALAWTFEHAADLGVDTARIGVMGESAGGGLAAALALLARDRGEYQLAFQHLIYPMIDDRTCVHPDPHRYVGEFIWNRAANLFGWTSLLGREPGGPDVSAYAAAARAEEVEKLPPTYIATGALDLFLEEDLEYARRLTRAGVPVELHVYPGAYHGFHFVPDAEVTRTAARDARAALKRALR